MKRIFAIILTLVVSFAALVGCNGDNDGNANSGNGESGGSGGNGGGQSATELTVEFKQDGKDPIIKKVKSGEKIAEISAPESEGEDLVTEWNFDFNKPVTENLTVGVISYTKGVSFATSFKGDGYNVSPYTGDSESVFLPDYYKGLPVTGITNSAFASNAKITFVKMPSCLKTIGEHAFYYCINLVSADIPETVETIGASAFDSCVKLVSLKLPPKITVVPKRFAVGHKYSFIEVPEGVTKIEEYAFANELKSIVLPLSLEKIEFVGLWKGLKEIYYKGSNIDWSLIEISDEEYNGFSAFSVTNDATVYYYFEQKPEKSGNFWHYDEDGNVAKW